MQEARPEPRGTRQRPLSWAPRRHLPGPSPVPSRGPGAKAPARRVGGAGRRTAGSTQAAQLPAAVGAPVFSDPALCAQGRGRRPLSWSGGGLGPAARSSLPFLLQIRPVSSASCGLGLGSRTWAFRPRPSRRVPVREGAPSRAGRKNVRGHGERPWLPGSRAGPGGSSTSSVGPGRKFSPRSVARGRARPLPQREATGQRPPRASAPLSGRTFCPAAGG